MKRFCAIFAILGIWMTLLGCDSMQRGSPSAMKDAATVPSEKLQEVINRLEGKPTTIHEANQEIIKKAEDTKEAAVTLQSNPPPVNVPEIAVQISKNSEAIKNAAVASDVAAVSIKEDFKQLQQAQVQVIDLAKENATLKQDLAKEKDASIQTLYSTLKWFFALSGGMIFAGIILAFTVNRKMGMVITAIGGLGLTLAAGAVFYLKTIATIGMALIVASLVLGVSYGIWWLFLTFRAVKENVKIIDAIKPELSPESKAKIFGNDIDMGLAGQEQSKTTKILVSKLRGKKK